MAAYRMCGRRRGARHRSAFRLDETPRKVTLRSGNSGTWPGGWLVYGLAMLFIITITMAGLSMVVVHALERNPWGTFAVFMTIPVAICVGLWERWALFGVSNQLMASIGLMIGATIILRMSEKRWYVLTCLVPLSYLYVTVNYAA